VVPVACLGILEEKGMLLPEFEPWIFQNRASSLNGLSYPGFYSQI